MADALVWFHDPVVVGLVPQRDAFLLAPSARFQKEPRCGRCETSVQFSLDVLAFFVVAPPFNTTSVVCRAVHTAAVHTNYILYLVQQYL